MSKIQHLTYVQSSRITDWKRIVLTDNNISFLYASNDDRIFSKIETNSLLWVIEKKRNRPPSLIARLEIFKVTLLENIINTDYEKFRYYREFKWIALCSENSIFYGYNNAEKELLNLNFENSKGKTWKISNDIIWKSDFGRKLQGPRKISKSHYNENPVFKRYDYKTRVFISWKWKDNSVESIKKLAFKLVDKGFIVWLDMIVLPKSKALKIVESDSRKLEKLLEYGYCHSDYLLAIDSPNYGLKSRNSAKNWTLREWQGKIAPKKVLKRILVKSSSELKSNFSDESDYIIEKNDVNSIVNRLESIDLNTSSKIK